MRKLVIALIVVIMIYTTKTYIIPVIAGTSAEAGSDLQLIARAINGEARGESYEGQVAVRSSNTK